MKYSLIILIVCGLALGMGVAFLMQRKVIPLTTANVSSAIIYSKATENQIIVTSPIPGSAVGKQFKITGSARGPWYFEASFPVKVVGKSGEVLAELPAKAMGDWMTEEFVPFLADIAITETYSGPATIVLKKDNPSGLPEHDASISFNILIK